jgi:hypothetical protein
MDEAVGCGGSNIMSRLSRIGPLPFWGLLTREVVLGFLIAAVSGGLFWLVWLYASGLRDPRALDGWVLAGGMIVQLLFHIMMKTVRLTPRSVMAWRQFHIVIGLVLISAFASHCDFTWPDTAFEWALWGSFVLVAASGVFGTYLAAALKAKRGNGEGISPDRVAGRRAEVAREAEAVVMQADPGAAAIGLPGRPQDAWILDLYTTHLRDFFQGQRNASAHAVGSQRRLSGLIGEIDTLARYVDIASQARLEALKTLVVEKDRLDFAAVHFGLTRAWLLVHVPVTYSLVVLSILHIFVVYAFSAGAR